MSTINNNDEVHLLLRLEAAIRVKRYNLRIPDGDGLQRITDRCDTIIRDTLAALVVVRGSEFDAKAAYEEMRK